MRRYAPVPNTKANARRARRPAARRRRPVRAVVLDLRLQVRYRIVAVAAMITALYAIGFQR